MSARRRLRWKGRLARRRSLAPATTAAAQNCGRRRIGDNPTNGQLGLLSALDHAPSEFWFGGKADMIGNVGCLSAWQISAPFFGQVQFAVDEGVAQSSDVGGKDADLAIFHAPGASAILGGDAWGVVSAFGETTFVEDQDREGRVFCGVGGAGDGDASLAGPTCAGHRARRFHPRRHVKASVACQRGRLG